MSDDECDYMSDDFLAKWDSMNEIIYEKDIGYEARQIWEGNLPLTIVRYRIAGAKMEQFRKFYDDPVPIQTTLNSRLVAEKLDDEPGWDLYHFRVMSPVPMIVANRSTFICYYKREEADGTLQMINSSLGNEKLVEKYKSKVGSDVIAQHPL